VLKGISRKALFHGTLVLCVGLAACIPTKSGNMNGKYSVTSGGNLHTNFNDDYASKGYEFFDVWAPEIATHYGEVFWTDQGTHPLPEEIVKRFDGKVIAIQGYEQDQVMVTPQGSPGVNPELDVSVPINWAYNHHYANWMVSKHAEMKLQSTPMHDAYANGAHGLPAMMVAVDKDDQSERKFADVAQTKWFISEGNGGESRKSFHGYPQGWAQLMESPVSWHATPMQIDTRNREHGVTPDAVHNCTNMSACAGYEPRQARYGRGWGGVNSPNKAPNHYSGILECPCNSRVGGDPEFYPDAKTKILTHSVSAIPSGSCKQGFRSAVGCHDAIASLALNATTISNKTAEDSTQPDGCLFVRESDGSATALYNTGGSGHCTAGAVTAAQMTSAKTSVTVGVSLGKEATITLTGPEGKWFAVGFEASAMEDQPYTLVANSSGMHERKLGTCGTEADHCPGTVLSPSITLVSNSVTNGVRTVVVTRALHGATKDHYTFQPDSIASINYISAVGHSDDFTYHTAHEALTLSFAKAVGTTCVCDGGISGQLCATNGTSCNKFTKSCMARSATLGAKGEDSGDLLVQRNPTCNSAQYSGGLTCCRHKRIMLDDDQRQNDNGPLLRYHMKYRFWFQEFVPANATNPNSLSPSKASHIDLPRIYWQTEGNAGEYDIPPAFYTKDQPKIVGYPEVGPYPELTPGSSCTGNCPYGDDCECVHTITYNKTVSNMRLIYAGGHCHAPACLGIWLYRNDPGHEMELLCHMSPVYGNGTGANTVSGMYDEEGYLSLPPCLWGEEEGLQPPVLLPANTEMVSVKKNRNTHVGHFGEMASWQMRGINF